FTEEQREAAGEKLSIPHMGWNQVSVEQPEHPFWTGVEPGTYFYFVHSYHVVPTEPECIATKTTYGYEFCSAVTRENLVGTQFHPEKSQGNGARLLENFVKRM
ncbi:MAG: imidazole glycerol phosphate synthase subunit HisH, partial [Thermoguttaceae bacterium]|nr:imidazole glycerol phosphate synthase subunit HisH [Thermoguttaceae bacterium]